MSVTDAVLRLLYQEAEKNKNRDVDLLEWLTLLARNPVGKKLLHTPSPLSVYGFLYRSRVSLGVLS